MHAERFKTILYAFADALELLTMTPVGLALLAGIIGSAFVLSVWNGVRERSLACEAAGKKLGIGEGTFVMFRELAAILGKIFTAGPVLLAVALGGVAVLGVADSLRKFDEIEADRKRIKELSAVVRNLDRRYRIAELRALARKDGRTKLSLAFYGGGSEEVARTQELEIAGTDIFLDAIVCNFDYSEIETGKRINLALPYRVFSDEVAQDSGIALELFDAKGVPYAYRRPSGEIYGIGPEDYDRRLEELSVIMEDNDASRQNGLVRSLYGSAVHRIMKPGDTFTVWVEQTGGLVIKDPRGF
ncbi:MAG: hypothetical protein NT080_13650 [Spirochaetes bacterium]|nr:hypothetical protein [Spirochaetota bacterium]